MPVDGPGLPPPPGGDALEVVLAAHRRVCLAVAFRVLRDRHLAEDAVQEAFLDAWRLSGTFDAARSSQQQWLLTLTHRRAVDRVRKEQRQGIALPSLEGLLPPSAADPEDQAWRAARARAVHAALPELTCQQGEVLVLAYYGGYTQAAIAALVGIPLGTVKTRTAAAKQRLKTLLAASCTDQAAG